MPDNAIQVAFEAQVFGGSSCLLWLLVEFKDGAKKRLIYGNMYYAIVSVKILFAVEPVFGMPNNAIQGALEARW